MVDVPPVPLWQQLTDEVERDEAAFHTKQAEARALVNRARALLHSRPADAEQLLDAATVANREAEAMRVALEAKMERQIAAIMDRLAEVGADG